jgi:cardiolipin synthase A/B
MLTKKAFEEQEAMNIGWIIASIIILTGVWLSLDYALGRKKHLASITRREYPIRNGHIEVYTHGMDLFSSFFKELRHAKHHIHVLFYILQDDSFCHEFLAILQEKAKAGVEVRLMVDWLGSKAVKRQTVQALEGAGVKFLFSNKPAAPFFFYTIQVRNHRKITVIDGKIGFLGGYNIGKEYIDGDPKLTPWRDYHLKITGESVRDLQREFLLDWKRSAKTDLLGNPIYYPELQAGPVRHQVFPSEGLFLEETFAALIGKAQHSITIGSPYFIPSDKLMKHLLNALKKGIRVTIIVPAKSDHFLVQEASYPYLRTLLKNGADVYQYMKGFYHAKTMVIDESVCDIGTANFDKRSLFLNDEINCYVYDAAFIQSIKNILLQDIQDSSPLSLAKLNRPNFIRSIKEVLSLAVSRFL